MAKYGKTSSDALRFVLEQLPANGLELDRDEYEGNTVVHFASSASHGPNNSVLEPLLQLHPEMARRINKVGMLPLHTALWKCCSSLRAIQLLLDVYPQAISLKDGTGFLPIHYACQEGVSDPQIVERLLDKAPATARENATIQSPNSRGTGSVPLHLALRFTSTTKFSDNQYMVHNMNAVILTLLSVYGHAARIKEPESGLLPIHLAILSGCQISILQKLVSLYPSGLTMSISAPQDTGIGVQTTALHLLTWMGPSVYSTGDLIEMITVAFHCTMLGKPYFKECILANRLYRYLSTQF